MAIPDLGEINMDCMMQDDLEHLAHAFENMALYAKLKAEAMLCRSEGNVVYALTLETRCDNSVVAGMETATTR